MTARQTELYRKIQDFMHRLPSGSAPGTLTLGLPENEDYIELHVAKIDHNFVIILNDFQFAFTAEPTRVGNIKFKIW